MNQEYQYWFSKSNEKLKGSYPNIEERDRLNDEVAYLMGSSITKSEKFQINKARLLEDIISFTNFNSKP
jgi:hypothetical protein